MPEYIATFPAGFEPVVQQLPQWLHGASLRGMYSGLVHLAYSGDERALLRLPCFGNVFQVIRSYHGKGLSLEKMVQSAAGTHARIGNPGKGGFRVRFQKEGRFVAVDKAISLQAERAAQRATGLRLDRLHPQVELWYILRREGVGYYALLQQGVRRAKGEPAPGELRPELAYLLCRMANISKGDWVCDPLAGHGAIPRQLLQHFPCGRVYASDLDRDLARKLAGLPHGAKVDYRSSRMDARKLESISDHSLDAIVSDPPWGIYDQRLESAIGEFYAELLRCFQMKLKEGGRLVLLTAQKHSLESALKAAGFSLRMRLDVLVNGKKAAAYLAILKRSAGEEQPTPVG